MEQSLVERMTLNDASYISIAQLSPQLLSPGSRAIKAVITLMWPYSSATDSISFLLSESDFRLRDKRGQVRVQFSGSSAKSITKLGIASGDHVALSLEGVEWVHSEPMASVPGCQPDFELRFKERLLLQYQQVGSSEIRKINIDHPQAEETPVLSSNPPVLEDQPSFSFPLQTIKNDLLSNDETIFSSPAFIKRSRTSYGSLFDSGFDPFAEEDGTVEGKGRKRTRLNVSWGYRSRSPTPNDNDQLVINPNSLVESVSKSMPLMMTDEGVQTIDLEAELATIQKISDFVSTENSVSARLSNQEILIPEALTIPMIEEVAPLPSEDSEMNLTESLIPPPDSPRLTPVSSASLPQVSPLLSTGCLQLKDDTRPIESEPLAENSRQSIDNILIPELKSHVKDFTPVNPILEKNDLPSTSSIFGTSDSSIHFENGSFSLQNQKADRDGKGVGYLVEIKPTSDLPSSLISSSSIVEQPFNDSPHLENTLESSVSNTLFQRFENVYNPALQVPSTRMLYHSSSEQSSLSVSKHEIRRFDDELESSPLSPVNSSQISHSLHDNIDNSEEMTQHTHPEDHDRAMCDDEENTETYPEVLDTESSIIGVSDDGEQGKENFGKDLYHEDSEDSVEKYKVFSKSDEWKGKKQDDREYIDEEIGQQFLPSNITVIDLISSEDELEEDESDEDDCSESVVSDSRLSVKPRNDEGSEDDEINGSIITPPYGPTRAKEDISYINQDKETEMQEYHSSEAIIVDDHEHPLGEDIKRQGFDPPEAGRIDEPESLGTEIKEQLAQVCLRDEALQQECPINNENHNDNIDCSQLEGQNKFEDDLSGPEKLSIENEKENSDASLVKIIQIKPSTTHLISEQQDLESEIYTETLTEKIEQQKTEISVRSVPEDNLNSIYSEDNYNSQPEKFPDTCSLVQKTSVKIRSELESSIMEVISSHDYQSTNLTLTQETKTSEYPDQNSLEKSHATEDKLEQETSIDPVFSKTEIVSASLHEKNINDPKTKEPNNNQGEERKQDDKNDMRISDYPPNLAARNTSITSSKVFVGNQVENDLEQAQNVSENETKTRSQIISEKKSSSQESESIPNCSGNEENRLNTTIDQNSATPTNSIVETAKINSTSDNQKAGLLNNNVSRSENFQIENTSHATELQLHTDSTDTEKISLNRDHSPPELRHEIDDPQQNQTKDPESGSSINPNRLFSIPPPENIKIAKYGPTGNDSSNEMPLSSPESLSRTQPPLNDERLRLNRNLRAELSDFTSLKLLRFHRNQKTDVLAVVTLLVSPPMRVKSGPKDYHISFNIIDPTIALSGAIQVHIFRPYQECLPIIEVGDGILLRNFEPVMVNKALCLRSKSREGSSWAVFRDDENPEIRGPPVEYGTREMEHIFQLKNWFGNLDDEAKAKIARANKNKMVKNR